MRTRRLQPAGRLADTNRNKEFPVKSGDMRHGRVYARGRAAASSFSISQGPGSARLTEFSSAFDRIALVNPSKAREFHVVRHAPRDRPRQPPDPVSRPLFLIGGAFVLFAVRWRSAIRRGRRATMCSSFRRTTAMASAIASRQNRPAGRSSPTPGARRMASRPRSRSAAPRILRRRPARTARPTSAPAPTSSPAATRFNCRRPIAPRDPPQEQPPKRRLSAPRAESRASWRWGRPLGRSSASPTGPERCKQAAHRVARPRGHGETTNA